MRSPRLVAEALRVVPDATATALPPIREADATVLDQLHHAARSPARAGGEPPAFLRDHQVDPWRRVMAALEGWRGVLLAEPVGIGKTWIALGVAASWRGRCTVIGPAALSRQWRSAASRAAIPIAWHSLERLSRGQPPPRASLVIVDEAHRLRHRDTRRVATLAPWLVGRATLLVTATPIVNRRRDLLALLELVVADDALVLDGIASLRALADCERPPPAIRRLVVRSCRSATQVATVTRRLPTPAAERRRAGQVAACVGEFTLDNDAGIRQLIATVLLDAAASSDAAWRAALRRYRALLLQSRDAGGASREALRRFAGPALDQLVLWPLLGESRPAALPPLDDLPRIEAALRCASDDRAWIAPLVRLLRDGRVTACFCRHRETAIVLARALGDGTAWVTGDAAGIGPHRMPRDDLLAAFGPARDTWRLRIRTPTVLVATEVLAEGLDLQGASRVVHVDLPWHATRLEQRTGRVRRAGQRSPGVEVIDRAVPRPIERLLGLRRRIARKGRIADQWLGAMTDASAAPGGPSVATWVAGGGTHSGLEAAVMVALDAGRRTGGMVVTIDRKGTASLQQDPAAMATLGVLTPGERRRATELAAIAVRHALGSASVPVTGRGPLIARVLQLARERAAARDGAALARLDRLLVLAGSPVTRGLELLLDRLRAANDRELLTASLPAIPGRDPVTVRWVAVVLYHQPGGQLP